MTDWREQVSEHCGRCKFYEDVNGARGRCRRNPPTVGGNKDTWDWQGRWPWVEAADWCGEWTLRHD